MAGVLDHPHATPGTLSILTVRYRCRYDGCERDFGDPEAARSFTVWAIAVRDHAAGMHGYHPRLVNTEALGYEAAGLVRAEWKREGIPWR